MPEFKSKTDLSDEIFLGLKSSSIFEVKVYLTYDIQKEINEEKQKTGDSAGVIIRRALVEYFESNRGN